MLDKAVWVFFANDLGTVFHMRWAANDEVWIVDNILKTAVGWSVVLTMSFGHLKIFTHLLRTAFHNKRTDECCVEIWDLAWIVVGISGVGLLLVVHCMTVEDAVGLDVVIPWTDMHTAVHMREAVCYFILGIKGSATPCCYHGGLYIPRWSWESRDG